MGYTIAYNRKADVDLATLEARWPEHAQTLLTALVLLEQSPSLYRNEPWPRPNGRAWLAHAGNGWYFAWIAQPSDASSLVVVRFIHESEIDGGARTLL
jgi:hypothetical protein